MAKRTNKLGSSFFIPDEMQDDFQDWKSSTVHKEVEESLYKLSKKQLIDIIFASEHWCNTHYDIANSYSDVLEEQKNVMAMQDEINSFKHQISTERLRNKIEALKTRQKQYDRALEEARKAAAKKKKEDSNKRHNDIELCMTNYFENTQNLFKPRTKQVAEILNIFASKGIYASEKSRKPYSDSFVEKRIPAIKKKIVSA